MRTVIIATKEHIAWINRYNRFFEPYLDSEIRFCEWYTDGEKIESIIPSIYECIAGHREWRAIILFDSVDKRQNLNPFDVVEKIEQKDYQEGNETIDEDFKNHQIKLEQQILDKKKTYDEAIQQPLTKLCTYLCAIPVDANEKKVESLSAGKEDSLNYASLLIKQKENNELNAYKVTSNYKKKLRAAFLNGDQLQANLPLDVYCVSLRTITDEAQNEDSKQKLAWKAASRLKYSDFVDRNMYFDRMRYFVFDILPGTNDVEYANKNKENKNHINYKYNYLQFIYTLLIFAKNPIPIDSVRPGILYCLQSSSEENKLKELIRNYDQKLENTVYHIKKQEEKLLAEFPGPLTDEDAEKLFQTKEVIPVTLQSSFNMDGFFAETSSYGLAGDCPRPEKIVWNDSYKKSDTVMHKFVKQPRRSVERAVEDLHRTLPEVSLQALALNHFQVSDIQDYSDFEEDKMISIPTKDFYDIAQYEEAMEKSNKNVGKVLETRMNRKTTIIVGVVVLLVFLIGFLPILLFNDEILDAVIPVLITSLSIIALAAVGYMALKALKKEVIDEINKYNDTMQDIKDDVNSSMGLFSRYLSCAYHILSGNKVLDVVKEKDNVFKQKRRIFRAHIENIREKQIELRDLLGEYCTEHPVPQAGEYYAYDFEKVKEYDYPIPFDENSDTTIPYVQDENKVAVPLDLISAISISMEDLYE